MRRAASIQVYGKVQGVWFRASTQKQASELNIYGFVKNQSDGSVYIEAEGEEHDLDDFIEWCRIGPPHAQVTQLQTTEQDLQGFKRFEIMRW